MEGPLPRHSEETQTVGDPMASTSAHSPPLTPVLASPLTPAGILESARPCPHCGGSGTLRLADQRYRTCLECLGRGRLVAIGETLPLAALRTASPVSSSAAR
jgi:hypothetical protein